jgi:hypothetical protein
MFLELATNCKSILVGVVEKRKQRVCVSLIANNSPIDEYWFWVKKELNLK